MIRIKLKAVLAEKGIKQKDLVAMTGIRQPTLSGMNNNSVKHIPLDVLDKLCTVLAFRTQGHWPGQGNTAESNCGAFQAHCQNRTRISFIHELSVFHRRLLYGRTPAPQGRGLYGSFL